MFIYVLLGSGPRVVIPHPRRRVHHLLFMPDDCIATAPTVRQRIFLLKCLLYTTCRIPINLKASFSHLRLLLVVSFPYSCIMHLTRMVFIIVSLTHIDCDTVTFWTVYAECALRIVCTLADQCTTIPRYSAAVLTRRAIARRRTCFACRRHRLQIIMHRSRAGGRRIRAVFSGKGDASLTVLF